MLRTSVAALMLFGSMALLSTPSFAGEPDVDSSAGPQLPAPRTNSPDYQQDDQSGAVLDPQAEGAQPTNPPDVVIVDPRTAPPAEPPE